MKNANGKKTTIALTSLAALSAFTVAFGPINAMAHPPVRMSHQVESPIEEFVEQGSFNVSNGYSEQAAVNELINSCNGRTSIIQRALVDATVVAHHDLNQAAVIVANAIKRAAQGADQFRVGTGYFHFIVALKGAAGVVDAIMNSTGTSQTLSPALVGQIRYGFLTELAELLINAHESLDVQYVYPVYRECEHRCGYDRDLPQDYFNGVAKLAEKFMSLMTSSSEGTPERYMLGSPKVELAVTKAVAHAAKIILINSRLRESYAWNVQALQNLEIEIQQMLIPGGLLDQEPSEARAIVRSEFDCIKIYPYVR